MKETTGFFMFAFTHCAAWISAFPPISPIITTASVYLTWAAALLSGSTVAGLAIGFAFGLARALPLFGGLRVSGPDQVAGWGYVHSAGYPQYYRGGSGHESNECRWTVRASRKRRVRLTILDLSIRSKHCAIAPLRRVCSRAVGFSLPS